MMDAFASRTGTKRNLAALREAYEPAVYAKWRQRPAIDIICTATDGNHGRSVAQGAALVE